MKNIERYSKGSFVHHSRRGKAHSNNPNAASQIKVNQAGMMIGLPKVGNHGVGVDDLHHGANGRSGEFSPSPIGNKSSSGFAAMISNSQNGYKMPQLVDKSGAGGSNGANELPIKGLSGLPSL